MRSRRLRGPACAAAVAVLTLVGAPFATAGTDEDGLWYLTRTHLEQVHERTTGTGITVAVLDTPINPDVASLRGTDLRLEQDPVCPDGTPVLSVSAEQGAAHAVGMVELLVGNGTELDGRPGPRGVAPDVTVLHYAATDLDEQTVCGGARSGEIIRAAVAAGADIVSMSTAGGDLTETAAAMAEAMRAGVVFVVATPNASEIGISGLSAMNGVVAVEAAGPDQSMDDPNAGALLTVVAPGDGIRHTGYADGAWDRSMIVDGTSNATAWTAGALALVWSAYPDATGNQVIQSLIRNTGTDDHELLHADEVGYGFVSVPHMLEHDPVQYPDVNPLLREDPEAVPSYADVTGTEPAATPGADAAPADEAIGAEQPLLAVLVVAGGLAVVAGVVVIVVRARGSGRRQPSDHQGV